MFRKIYSELSVKQKISFWLCLIFVLAVITISSLKSAAALDKWGICANLNLSSQDCDDFWNNLTYAPQVNLSSITQNISNLSTKEEMKLLLSNLTLNLSVLQQELRFQELNNSFNLKLLQKDVELAQFNRSNYVTKEEVNLMIANAVASVNNKNPDTTITSAATQNQQTPLTQQSYFPVILVIILAAGFYAYERFIKRRGYAYRNTQSQDQGRQDSSQQHQKRGKQEAKDNKLSHRY